MNHMARTRLTLVPLASLAFAMTIGCTMHKQEAPPLAGPSTLGTSITVSASPDVLAQDGASQALVTIVAADSNGQPLRNLTLRAEIGVSGVIADFGTLSAHTVVTDGSGRASLIFTAPPPPAGPAPTTNVDILITPIGTDFGNEVSRQATIRLVPSGVVAPPRGSVTPAFTVTPASPLDHEPALFDGTASKSTTGTIVTWSWSFGDGKTASGQTVTHSFSIAGSFPVTLTATDSIGASNSITQAVTVGQGALPTAIFIVSPSAPIVGQNLNFNAAQSRPAPGRTIRFFDWDFGDGSQGSGVQVGHAYATAGTFTVLLTVTDDAGRTATAAQPVTVATGDPTADFTFSPAAPTSTTSVQFDAGGSKPATGRTIVSYDWSFGDGTPHGAGVTTAHVFAVPGTYTVRLTVTDDQGRTSFVTKSITVS
jgi:PKD repeat protein